MDKLAKNYRFDINGLRTVAVLLVLIFHVNAAWLPAGFLGVDVFLVISGYLISKGILSDLQKDSFALKDFYTRRIQRLFPALAFTLFASLVAGCFLLSAGFLERLAKSTLAAILSVSNFFFWSEDGYFDLASGMKPILHTWSLGLEEQFYLIWPILILVFYKFLKKKIILGLIALSVVSLGLSMAFNAEYATATFFLLPFRVFEFGLGALCIWIEPFIKKNKLFSESATILGLALIIGSSCFFNEYTTMPGHLSLIPCFGAMLIVFNSPAVLSKIFLENKLFEIIGKASYSIYLIHWPLVVYYKEWTLADLNIWEQITLIIASIVLGILMYMFIERLFKKSWFDTKRIWLGFLIGIVSISAFALVILQQEGFADRVENPYTMTAGEIIAERNRYWKESGHKKYKTLDPGKRNILVIGNSHAIDLVYALTHNGLKSNVVFLNTTDRCSNFGAVANVPEPKEINHCKKVKNRILKRKEWDKVEAVYLHDNWVNFNIKNLQSYLAEIRQKTDVPIYIFGPKMMYANFPLSIIKKSNTLVPKEINEFAKAHLYQRCQQVNEALLVWYSQSMLRESDIHFIDLLAVHQPYPLVSEKNAKLMYFDGSHLSEEGATQLGKKLKREYEYLFE